MLRLTKGNSSSLSLSMVKDGGWLLLSTSDNEAGIVLTWPFVVGVVVEQEMRTNFSEVRILPFREFNLSHKL